MPSPNWIGKGAVANMGTTKRKSFEKLDLEFPKTEGRD
jgi:hypothetical protein